MGALQYRTNSAQGCTFYFPTCWSCKIITLTQ